MKVKINIINIWCILVVVTEAVTVLNVIAIALLVSEIWLATDRQTRTQMTWPCLLLSICGVSIWTEAVQQWPSYCTGHLFVMCLCSTCSTVTVHQFVKFLYSGRTCAKVPMWMVIYLLCVFLPAEAVQECPPDWSFIWAFASGPCSKSADAVYKSEHTLQTCQWVSIWWHLWPHSKNTMYNLFVVSCYSHALNHILMKVYILTTKEV